VGIRDVLLSAAHGVGAVLVPGECLLCGAVLSFPLRGPCCVRCLDRLPRITAPYCPRCGLPYDVGVHPGLCGPCRAGCHGFRRARAGFFYENGVRELLLALKFDGRERVASALATISARTWCRPGGLDGYSGVVPVPLSRRRRRERGYNQAERIARTVARITGLPVRRRILAKTSERRPQAGLTASARQQNAAGAYRASLPVALRGRDLLLVDDVLTTGATAEAAAKALRRAGARFVDVLTLARVR